MFPKGDANAGGADVKMAVLVVASVWCEVVEIELDVNGVG